MVRPSAYGLLGDEADRVAVLDTPQGLILPGGGMDPGESAADTVVREAREECGLVLATGSWRLYAVELIYSTAERTHFEKRCTFLDVRIAGPAVAPIELDHELLWLEPDEAMAELWHESHRWAVGEWSARRAGA